MAKILVIGSTSLRKVIFRNRLQFNFSAPSHVARFFKQMTGPSLQEWRG